MDQRRRDMLLRVIDGRADLPPVAYMINNLSRADEVLSWLIRNRITGDEFARWFFIEQKASFLAASKFIISRLESEKNPESRPLYLGRDFKQ